MSTRPTIFAAGDVIEVGEDHYRYGCGGTLRLRVAATLQRFPDGWIELHGTAIAQDGSDGAQRFAVVDPAHVKFLHRAPRSA